MAWPRNEPDPLEQRRRQLAQQERQIAEQMARLAEKLQEEGEPEPVKHSAPEPPVWRMEEEGTVHRMVEPTPRRKRNLGRQRQRDMMIFFICMGVLVVVLLLVAWIAYSRTGSA